VTVITVHHNVTDSQTDGQMDNLPWHICGYKTNASFPMYSIA